MSGSSKKFLLVSLLMLTIAVAIPLIAQAAFSLSLSFLTTPIGGKIITIIPNPPALPTIPPTPNPCYKPNTWLVTLGLPSAGEYVLDGSINIINGSNPPTVGVWSLGLASQGLSTCPLKKIDGLLGVSKLF